MNDQPPEHDHDQVFVATLTRRGALGTLAALGIGLLVGCGDDDDAAPATTGRPATSGAGSTTTTASTATTVETMAPTTAGTTAPTTAATGEYLDFPEETNGPFPADGSNDNGAGAEANVLADPRSIRSDLTVNLDGSDPQPGIPIELTMRLGRDGAPVAGAAVYVWHCNRDGNYSVYASRMNGGDFSDSTWGRGVQVTDGDGAVTFQTIFPGRYQGRATHFHFEVYADDSFSDLLLTSQIGFEDDDADAVYASDAAYAASLRNPTYNANDNVFADGDGSQISDLGNPPDATALAATVNIAL